MFDPLRIQDESLIAEQRGTCVTSVVSSLLGDHVVRCLTLLGYGEAVCAENAEDVKNVGSAGMIGEGNRVEEVFDHGEDYAPGCGSVVASEQALQ